MDHNGEKAVRADTGVKEPEEDAMVEAAKNGDVEAFENLMEKYQKRVFNMAFRILSNYDDASETAQEVFIKIYRSLSGFRGDSSFSTWVYTITRNLCMDRLRKESRGGRVVYIDEIKDNEGEGIKMELPDNRESVEETAEKNELKRIVWEAVGKLSAEHREVIVMRDMQGFTYEEIARMTGNREGTVKSRLNRARLALREILKDKKELLD